MSKWICIFGERDGVDIKLSESSARTPAITRLNTINNSQTTNESYVCLGAALGETKDHDAMMDHFESFRRTDKGKRKEYFWPEPEVVEYAAWFRSQWFVSPNGKDRAKGWTAVDPDVWLPDGPGRRMPEPVPDPEKLVQDWETLPGPLSGTPWSWFPNPKASIQDYFTPPLLVEAAAQGMGGIDLDAASHWLANRHLRIPQYFHRGMSAFEHEWRGNVWLNPPYGDNDPWWARILEEFDAGRLKQICILSPVWAYTTQIARPLMDRSAAMLLLSPTPKFWGNKDPKKTGKNHPHAIVYIGDRSSQVLEALAPFGIPMHFDVSDWAGGVDADGEPRESPYEEYEEEYIHNMQGNNSEDEDDEDGTS